MFDTVEQYTKIISKCREIFEKKAKDYGTAWRILRTSSLTDQIFIKAQRIRTIQETGINKVGEDIENDFIGIINYCTMAVIQLKEGNKLPLDISVEKSVELFNKYTDISLELMKNKNHDYGEAWKDLRVSSLTDLILMKVLRVKQIENNEGKTIDSEGIDANYYDMLNYAVFALVHLKTNK